MATLAFDDRNLRWHKFEADEDPPGCGVVSVVSTPLIFNHPLHRGATWAGRVLALNHLWPSRAIRNEGHEAIEP
jgi:hypothetical protein